jgi:hypothetical protein
VVTVSWRLAAASHCRIVFAFVRCATSFARLGRRSKSLYWKKWKLSEASERFVITICSAMLASRLPAAPPLSVYVISIENVAVAYVIDACSCRRSTSAPSAVAWLISGSTLMGDSPPVSPTRNQNHCSKRWVVPSTLQEFIPMGKPEG